MRPSCWSFSVPWHSGAASFPHPTIPMRPIPTRPIPMGRIPTAIHRTGAATTDLGGPATRSSVVGGAAAGTAEVMAGATADVPAAGVLAIGVALVVVVLVAVVRVAGAPAAVVRVAVVRAAVGAVVGLAVVAATARASSAPLPPALCCHFLDELPHRTHGRTSYCGWGIPAISPIAAPTPCLATSPLLSPRIGDYPVCVVTMSGRFSGKSRFFFSAICRPHSLENLGAVNGCRHSRRRKLVR